MSIVVKAGPAFVPAPEGSYSSVLVDVVDLGFVSSNFNGKVESKPMVKVVWQIAETMPDSDRLFTVSRRYNQSLHKKATLRRDLESMRGRAFTELELKGFDLESLVGLPCLLNVVHKVVDGVTYANVSSVMQLPKGMTQLQPRDYVRAKDREQQNGASSKPMEQKEEPEEASSDGISDDDVPF